MNNQNNTTNEFLRGLFKHDQSQLNGCRSFDDIFHDLRTPECSYGDRCFLAEGLGVQDIGIPSRFFTYIVPFLHLVNAVSEKIDCQIYIAAEGALRANKSSDPQRLRSHANQMVDMLKCYIGKVHPHLSSRIEILVDKEVPTGSEVELYVNELFERGREVLLTDEGIKKFIEKRNGTDSLRYAIEHAIYMRDCVQDHPIKHVFVPKMDGETSAVVMVGGESERLFYRARKIIEELLYPGDTKPWKTDQLFCVVGQRIPTYHVVEGEPIGRDISTISSAQELFEGLRSFVTQDGGRQTSIARDYLILLDDASGRRSIATDRKTIHSALDGTLEPHVYKSLNEGLRVIKEIMCDKN